jgi:hypothetical protein
VPKRLYAIAFVAAFLTPPAAAQWFSDRPAQCPVGTALSRSGKCVKSSRRSKPSASPSLPGKSPRRPANANRPKVVPASKVERGACPKGAYPIKTEAGVLCVPVAQDGGDARRACSDFNGGFSGWYRAQAAEYESLAKRNRDAERAMSRHIERQKTVEKDLRRKMFRQRNKGVRQELTVQWNAVRRDIASNKKHLAATKNKHRAEESRWKKAFEARLKKKIVARPAGCKVAVASKD